MSDDRAGIKMSDATQHDAHTAARKQGWCHEIDLFEPRNWTTRPKQAWDEVEVVQCLRGGLVDSLW